MDRVKTGEAIRKWRKNKGLTQAQLANICGVSTSSVAKYESGENRIPYENALKIADALDVTLADLQGQDNHQEADAIIDLARRLFNSAGYDLLMPWEHGEESYRKLCKVKGHGQSYYLHLTTISRLAVRTSRYFRFLLDELQDGNDGE